ncbi:Sel1 domain protein repeat-containing protein [Solidesulfovibrio fructosivorans JJ]]|uniref:Sel1 domain protein repeat-containing protein n=1 Tax=Solidesulfovibrio fructosivorans JJ] TaxID=596151 RepID=E1JRK0_SOLFR|nr:SEL1-like repeat protein [Solidesulfovibrio fructosivorans]EFL53201.1 Sel1 domain protein repeat-containing protein [Solidesulfovibrio fructosivorans JJ]]
MPDRVRSGRRLAACAAALFLVVMCCAPAVSAQKTADAPEAADIDAPASFAAMLAKAQAGDPRAQCEVGVAYLNGDHVSQDFRQGLAWLSRASDAGFAYARYVLADVYSRGYAGVPASDANAYYYATLAAASSTLGEKYKDRAIKLRDASAARLGPAKVAGLQAKAALAPLSDMVDNAN